MHQSFSITPVRFFSVFRAAQKDSRAPFPFYSRRKTAQINHPRLINAAFAPITFLPNDCETVRRALWEKKGKRFDFLW